MPEQTSTQPLAQAPKPHLSNINGTCAVEDGAEYEAIFLSPQCNPTSSDSNMQPLVDNAGNNTTIGVQILGSVNTYVPYVPKGSLVAGDIALWADTRSAVPVPVNMCPQNLSTTISGVVIQSASALVLPLRPTPTGASPDPILYVLPGQELNPESNAVANETADGLANTIYIVAKQSCVLFLELGGAVGGSVPIYTTGVDATGTAQPLDPSYVGGLGGVVFGTYTLKENEVLKVFMGSQGTLQNNLPQPFDGNGQGGLATPFAGSNGGGASYIVHHRPFQTLNAIDAAFQNVGGRLVAVAGGGGGASRNASGGSAGFSGNPPFAQGIETSFIGSSGGRNFILGPAPIVPGLRTIDLSGGGGVQTAGGMSKVTNQSPKANSSHGYRLVPFTQSGLGLSGQGGASVNTITGSGGGGGGGGLWGGGAGGYNGLTKPNNVHGAGGGGSSSTGLLAPVNKGKPITINPYRFTNGYVEPTSNVHNIYKHGYLVIILKTVYA